MTRENEKLGNPEIYIVGRASQNSKYLQINKLQMARMAIS